MANFSDEDKIANNRAQVNTNYFLLNNNNNNNNEVAQTNISNQFRNPNSIESFTAPSPAGSLIEQFDATTTPLSHDDASDTSINIDNSNSGSQNLNFISKSSSFDSNNSNFRFRRHSSQSSINLPLNLQINNNGSGNGNSLNGISNTNSLVSPLTLSSSSNLNNSNGNQNGNINGNNVNFANTERVCSVIKRIQLFVINCLRPSINFPLKEINLTPLVLLSNEWIIFLLAVTP